MTTSRRRFLGSALGTAGLAGIAGDPATTFANTFPLPQPILDAIGRQIDVVLGGI